MDIDYIEEEYLQPVNGIVQPPVVPPPGKLGRRTNVLDCFKSVLGHLLNGSWSFHFRYPVDAVALCIPDYHDLIRHPMDLNTIRQRLHNNYYWDGNEALLDFELIFDNCMLYNPKGSPVQLAGKELKGVFYDHLTKIDMCNEIEIKKRKKKSKHLDQNQPKKSTQYFEPQVQCEIPINCESEHEVLVEVKYEPVIEPEVKPQVAFEVEVEAEAEAEIEDESMSILDMEPDKLEVSSRVLLDWQNYLIEKHHSERLLKSLTKRKLFHLNWVFNSCDLWRRFARNPNYDHDRVEQLDWAILKDRLDRDQFNSFDDFVETIRVMLQNALTCFPIVKTVVDSVFGLNEFIESRLDEYRKSITVIKKRVRRLVPEKIYNYNNASSH
ncbi:bromodomain-containing protein bet-1 [Drosophila grimshawi]|uniref:GH19674 n=1 Tax=Drosophila grimshawi TaxID=7222 RepID=B4K037_DROGR|nr:bromodomain-containing protein bet-1 [Drosophila grimshawi]EDV91639.1 GH19674 [Drosophila grimshawi]